MRARLRALLTGAVILAILAVCMPALAESTTITSLEDLEGKRIGVATGSTFDKIVTDNIPNAKIQYFNSLTDMVEALMSHKIDAFPNDEPVMRMIASENPSIKVLDERLDDFSYGVVLPKNDKGKALKAEIDTWLEEIKASGELEATTQKWLDGPEEEKTIPDYRSFPATRGTLRMATEGIFPPMDYYSNNELVGLDIDLTAQFCEDNGYGLELLSINFDGILPAIQTGKADFSLSGITITEERKESVLFSEPYYVGGTVMGVLDPEGAAGSSFFGGIVDSFQKTFIRENRWKLFLEGVGTTLLITLLSIAFGTIVGFLVFVACRRGGRIANGISGACMWLIQGMPGVVLLMVLYYIVFGSFSIGGVAVSVVAFTLTFGTAVFGLLKTGVNAVDAGQREAAYALGYSDNATFFRIILPQALPHAIGPYQDEVVNLIKATSIVGYIAVQDLTKMGDIVRSRTYDAFFPLIAVTVIYFALEFLLWFAVSRIKISIDPKRRSADDILKGVRTDD